jgi:pimeloyl-ACP methyl ester carboxylesterase
MAAEQTGTLDAPHGAIAWRELGEGPPLVLLNGYAATIDDWDPAFLGALAEHFTVTLPEGRGMGSSELGSEPLTVASLAADVELVMDEREIGAAAVVGWSMGGMVAQELAGSAPDRIASLALISTDPGGERTTPPDPEVWARLTDHRGSPREQASRLLALLFPPDVAPRIDRQFGDVVAAARGELAEEALDAQEEAMRAWHQRPHRDRLSGLDVPILVACGTEDEVIPPANSLALAAENAQAWLARFPGAGHAVMAQEPERLAGLIGLCTGRRETGAGTGRG